MNVGSALWALGHYDDARRMLDEASGIAQQKGGSYTALEAAISLVAAEMSLNELKFAEAAARSQQALYLAGAEDKVAAVQGKYLMGQAQTRLGRAVSGQRLCHEASDAAASLGDPLLLARARLALAEETLNAGDTKGALEGARLAQTFFGGAGLQESEWRAWLIAGLASQKSGDNDSARSQLANASARLSSLQQKWGAEVFKSYLARPDIRVYRQQLDQGSKPSP